MNEPYRLRVQKALTDLFKTITPDAGYNFDLSDKPGTDGSTGIHVVRGKRVNSVNVDPLPLVSILENLPERGDPISQPINAAIVSGIYALYVYGFATDDKQNPTDPAHYLLDDITRAVAGEMHKLLDPNLGLAFLGMSEIAKCEVGPIRNCFPPGTGNVNSEVAFCILELRFGLVENLEASLDPSGEED